AGAIDSPYQFHWRRFLFENFPKGTGFPALQAPAIKETLPVAPVRAFSIDDSATTEIDDALSVQGLGSGTVTFGIHSAAPGLAFAFRLARHLKAQREVVRGKPENFNRPDYNFRLVRDDGLEGAEPQGTERVLITIRQRGSPLDLIVAEAMILANSTWGGWIAQ